MGCGSSTECQSGFCDAQDPANPVCAPEPVNGPPTPSSKPNGDACGSSTECQSGFCDAKDPANPVCGPMAAPVKVHCGGGMYVKNKNTSNESCRACPAGKTSKEKTLRNRRCKKCGKNTYIHQSGKNACLACPTGFHTKGQRGKKQCFKTGTGESMRKLLMILPSDIY